MASFDNGYSHFVAWMKIVLPLLALGILSTLFLVSQTFNSGDAPILDNVPVSDMGRDQKISGPSVSGVSDDGSAYTITAKSAKPNFGADKGITAQNITAVVDSVDGTTYTVTAPSGLVDSKADMGKLEDGVVVETSKGTQIKTDSITSDLAMSQVTSGGTITGAGPFGNFTAGKMVMTQQRTNGKATGYLLDFTGGVNLLYIPENE